MQLDGAVILALIDSCATHCFVQQSTIPDSCSMFEGSELKVWLTIGNEFYTGTKCLLPITFDPGLEHIVYCYVVDKLITMVTLGMQWL